MWRKIRLVLVVMIISIGIVVTTAWFPAMFMNPVHDQQITFVTEDNLVDMIASVPVDMRIRKVKLDHTILSIDLILAGKRESQVVFHDLFRIAQYTIGRTSNLNRVLVRVFETDHNADGRFPRNSLLLSTDMKRNNLIGISDVKFDKSSNFYRKLMEAKSEITYTERWSQHFSK